MKNIFQLSFETILRVTLPLSIVFSFQPFSLQSQTTIGGVNMGNLTDYLLVYTDANVKGNWQGATKGFVGDVAIDGIQANETTSGTVPYAGTIYTNDATLGAWQDIVDDNDPPEVSPAQAFASYNQVALINGLQTDLTNAFSQINALTATVGYTSVASTSLNGLNTQNSIAEVYVINVTSGITVSSQINITGDAGDVFFLRWDTDANFGNGYQGQVKFQSGGAIVPLGGLKPSNFIHVAGDLGSSGGGSNPAAPYPQGPRYSDGLGSLITNGADFNGGGFFTGYWLTTGSPTDGKTSSLSNGIFVGGWYSSTTEFSMTSGTSGVYVSPNICTISSITATPGACVPASNQYTLTGTVTFTNAPTSGTLTVQITGGGSQVFSAPFTSPINYSIAGQTSDGVSHTVTATFSADASCTANTTYTAPASCQGVCSVCTEPVPDAGCTIPTSGYDQDKTITAGVNSWGSVFTGVDPQNVGNQQLRVVGAGLSSIIRVGSGAGDLNLILNNAATILVVENATLEVWGEFQLPAGGARFILKNGALRTKGNVQQSPNSIVCITGSEVEVGEEQAGGQFSNATKTSANFQNDGGYRYLKYVCLNVTHDFQLQSTGSGTGTNGVDVLIHVCGEIGDQGPTHAATGTVDGDDSGNFQNSKNMTIINSEFVVIENVQTQSGGETSVCSVDFRTLNGNFDNSGTIDGCDICVWVDDGHTINNNGTWTASVDKRRGTIGAGSLPGNPPNSTIAEIQMCFGNCICIESTCVISGVTATPGACVPATNQYTLTGTVTFTNPPASGTLTVQITGGGSQVFSAPFTSPINYSIAGQTSDGASHTVTATFSANPSCTANTTYTAPASCQASTPVIGAIKLASVPIANGDGTYSVTYRVLVRNHGPVVLHDIVMTDNLSTEFGTYESMVANVNAPGEYTVTSAPAIVDNTGGANFGPGDVVGSYTGSGANQTVVNASSSLPVGATFTVAFTIRFFPNTNDTEYFNQATVTGDDTPGPGGTPTTDLSDNGGCFMVGDPNIPSPNPDADCDGNPNEPGENDPTVIMVPTACPANAGTLGY